MQFLRSGGSNAQHMPGVDGSTSPGKTRANIDGRASALRLLRFVRSLPGCEKARLVRMPTETGIRETWRIVGEEIVTEADYVGGRVFDDAVCHAFYPIDLHDENGVKPKPLRKGVVPTVPLGALVPMGSRNLMAAGRIVSSDRAANSALRVQASRMAMGQAAGAAATLAARAGITPSRGVNGLDVFSGVPRLETPPPVIDGMLLFPRGAVNCRIRRAMGVRIPAAGDCVHVFSQLVDRLVRP